MKRDTVVNIKIIMTTLLVCTAAIAAPVPTTEDFNSKPTIEQCGSGAALSAETTHIHGSVTVGLGATTCTIRFKAFHMPPHCIVRWQPKIPPIGGRPDIDFDENRLIVKLPVSGANFIYFCPPRTA